MKLTAIVEIPFGSRLKYEEDKLTGRLKLDRLLNQPIPYNYGYIPGTLCEDGDALDVFVITNTPIYPLSLVSVDVIAVLKCLDGGVRDDKIIATLIGESDTYRNGGTAGTSVIYRYLETYKEGFTVLSLGDKEEAIKIYEESVKSFKG